MISSIELLAGASLSQMLQREATYSVRRTANETISITLSAPDLQAEGLHLQTWGSSYLLANRLHQIAVIIPETAHILELGAGTGLVGLSAAAIWGRRAVLTDFDTIAPGTAANIALNRTLLQQFGGEVHCGSLDWHDPETLVPVPVSLPSDGPETKAIALDKTRAHVILTADTLYTDEQPTLLARCIRMWLARDASARAIVCYPLRVGSLDAIREFWSLMDQAGFEAVTEQQERVEGEEWDDEKLHEWAVFRWREIPTD